MADDGTLVSQLKPNLRLYERRRRRDPLVHHVELNGSVERLSIAVATHAAHHLTVPCNGDSDADWAQQCRTLEASAISPISGKAFDRCVSLT